jgi:flagellar hook-associated protein 2
MSTINFAGLASGIDTNALIDATTSATRKAKITPKTTKVNELTDTNDSFTELKARLRTLKTESESMGTINGGIVAKTATSSSETVATAIASNGALNGTYDLSVTSLAKAASYSFNYPYTSATDTLFNSGETGTVEFQIGTSSTETVTINVTAGMTLSDFVNQFNNESSRAEASIVQVSSTEFRLLITTNSTGTNAGSIVASTVSANSRISTAVGSGANEVTTSPATNATFTLNGIGPFTRQSNTINDVISGVTFSLLSSPGSTKITVANDPDTSLTTMKRFVTAFNEIVTYISENNTITEETSTNGETNNVFGSLASTRTDDSALTALRESFFAIAYSGTSQIRILADLGIETQRDGTIALNETKFKNALNTDATAVSEISKSLGDRLGFTYNPATPNKGIIDSIIGFNRSFDLTINSNKSQIDNLNKEISEVEKQIAQTEQNMRSQFARLESLMSRLQSQQQSLTSALAGLR